MNECILDRIIIMKYNNACRLRISVPLYISKAL